MRTIDLLGCVKPFQERPLALAMQDPSVELLFNGRLVCGDAIGALVAARRELATRLSVDQHSISPSSLAAAIYHPEEKAIYFAFEFLVSGLAKDDTPVLIAAERVLRAGPNSGEVESAPTSCGNAAMILELMDAIDLKRVVWLPYTE